MPLGLGKIAYTILLSSNAVCILSPNRFILPLTGTTNDFNQVEGIRERSVKLVNAMRTVMRFPLIGINLVVIVYEILLG